MKNSLQQKHVLNSTGNRHFFSQLQKLAKKSLYNSFLLIFFLIIIPSNAQASYAFSGGDGSESNPWQITTLTDLDSIHDYLDSNFILMNDLDFDGSAFDSTNSAEGWVPIGNISTPFTGSFNGAGHTINNLYINRPSTAYIGLFGNVEGAVIDSLWVLNCNITGVGFTGGLVGRDTYSSTISNCGTTGKISGEGSHIGGIAGSHYDLSIMSDCYSTAQVSGNSNVGGLVGTTYNSSIISNCYATGEVSGGTHCAGLVGDNESATISYCYATGNVSGTGNNTGGLVGTNKTSISNCYATGKVNGNNYTGGLVGYNTGAITNVYVTGQVSGISNVDGMAGYHYISGGSITNAYYNTVTTGQSSTYGTGLSTKAMKQQDSLSGFNFDTVWTIRADSTYPALQTLDNAPFTFADTITGADKSTGIEILLENDYDYETLQNAHVIKIIDVDSGYTKNNRIFFKESANGGDTIHITYRTGEIKPLISDTLWGNMATSLLIRNYAPVITATNDTTISEDTPITLSYDYVIVSDSDGDTLSLIVDEGDNYTLSGFTVTPIADYNGTLLVPVSVTDGKDTSNIMNISITVDPVNDKPELTAVSNTSTLEDTPITLSSNDITASDVDGDELSLVVYTGDNYTVVDSTITPIANYNGTLSVPVSVTDGKDTSNIMNISITVDPVNDLPLLTSVKDTSTYKNTPITLTMNDVTASDVDGDALSLVVYAGDNYTFSGATVTPATDYTGTLSVPVSVTDGTDTTTNMTINITVGKVSGINNVLANDIQLFPNPVSSKLIIQGIKGTTTFEIININGQIVFTRNVLENEAIDVSTLPKGSYVVVLKEYGVSKKLIIDN